MLASTLIRDAERMGLSSPLRPVGSLRRFAPEVGDVRLLGVATPERQPQLLDGFARLGTGTLGRDATSVQISISRGAVTLHLATPEQAGSAMVWYTGSIGHTARLGARARQRGLTFDAGRLTDGAGAPVPAPTEDDFYEALGLPFIAPELREGADEIDAADRGALPNLITDLNIRGDLHMHSVWSDGRDSVADMVQASRQLGYEYVAITDHSERSLASRSLGRAQIATQRDEVEAIRAGSQGIEVLWGVEVDIMHDGSLDFDDETLAGFDIVLASLHDSGGQGPAALTERYLKAIDNPYVNVITHPANRSPGYSSGYDVDFDRLFAAAAASGTALEVDGAPGHLDMDGALARRAVAAGATLTIDSDCHRRDALARQMRFGVGTARRGWVEPQHVLNARAVGAVRDFVARKRGRMRG